ncbi:hypothetical protein HJFPF1_04435 [Paramyrothecium foliicola]|nr:hypothetical protein HJFPF1_04435 [Paramyrothecium foliicola]
MTFRNLNQTWRDVVFKQYEQDHAADVPLPIRYLIKAHQWKRDIFIEIPIKIDPPVLRQAVLRFCRARRLEDDPAYEDDLIKVRARIRPAVEFSTAQHHDNTLPQRDTDQAKPGTAVNAFRPPRLYQGSQIP